MAKRVVSGKRFSRVADQPLETHDEIKAAVIAFKPFAQQIAEDVERAREFLRGLGLPDAPKVVRLRATGEWVSYSDQEPADLTGVFDLDEYLLRHCGIKRDDPAHIAARAVVLTAGMQHPDRDMAIKAAYQLGRLHSLSLVYHAEKVGAIRRGRKPKRKPWAEALDDRINCWENIAGHNDPIVIEGVDEDYEIYRGRTMPPRKDGETVVCIIDDGVNKRSEELTKESFMKRYFTGAKKRGQQRR